MPTEVVDLLEAVEVDHHHGRADRRCRRAAKASAASSRSRNSSRFGRPVRLSCTASCSSRSSAVLNSVTSVSVPTSAHHLAVGADHGPRLQREPEIMAVGGAQAEFLRSAGRGAVRPRRRARRGSGRGRADAARRASRAAGPSSAPRLRPSSCFGLRAGEDLVGGHVPVPDHVAGAGQRQRAALDVGDDAVRRRRRRRRAASP